MSLRRYANQYGECQSYNLFSKIETEEDAYWLGVMYSDGWVRSDHNSIGLGSIDIDLIQKFQRYTQCKNKVQVKEKGCNVGRQLPDGHMIKSSQNFYSLEFSSKQTKENLKKLGCVPAKSKILQCPSAEQVPDSLLRHFLRGYVDGDGWVTWNDNAHRYSFGFVGTQNFIEQICTRAKILHYGTLRKKSESSQYEFAVYKKEIVKKLLDYLYADAQVYLNRKFNSYLLSKGRSSI